MFWRLCCLFGFFLEAVVFLASWTSLPSKVAPVANANLVVFDHVNFTGGFFFLFLVLLDGGGNESGCILGLFAFNHLLFHSLKVYRQLWDFFPHHVYVCQPVVEWDTKLLHSCQNFFSLSQPVAGATRWPFTVTISDEAVIFDQNWSFSHVFWWSRQGFQVTKLFPDWQVCSELCSFLFSNCH